MRRTTATVLLGLLCAAPLAATGCKSGSASGPVTIQQADGFYDVALDFAGTSHRAMGRQLALSIVQAMPDYESAVDLAMATQMDMLRTTGLTFEQVVDRARTLYANPAFNADYRDEIAGMQDVFTYDIDLLRDGRLSRNELLVFQFLSEVMRPVSCSASAVMGDASATGSTIIGRNLEWLSALDGSIAALHAVTTFRNGSKSMVNVGILGQLGGLTVFNRHRVLGAILNSTTGAPYPSDDLGNRRSFFFDLREAFETFSTLGEIAAFMKDPEHRYVYNHLIFLADPVIAGVVENQVNNRPDGASGNRSFRTSTSALNSDLLPEQTWGISSAFAAVNDFRLPGNDYKPSVENYGRWGSYRTAYAPTATGRKVDVAGLMSIAGYTGPMDDGVMSHGAIFCSEVQRPFDPGLPIGVYVDHDDAAFVKPAYTTVQSIVADMGTMDVWVHFIPATPPPPRQPTYRKLQNTIF